MGSFLFHHSLVVMAVLMTSTSGFFLRETFKESYFGENPLKELSRHARDENEMLVNATEMASPTSEAEICRQSALACMYRLKDAYGVTNQIFNFEFEEFTRGLGKICPVFDGFSMSSCRIDNCEMSHNIAMITFTSNVLQFACEHLQELQDNAACWADPFESTMTSCTQVNISSKPSVQLEAIGNCLARSVETLPNCNIEAKTYFLHLTAYLIREQMKLYEAFYSRQ